LESAVEYWLEYKEASQNRLYEVLFLFELVKSGIRLKNIAKHSFISENEEFRKEVEEEALEAQPDPS
jgi:hypothetical protein